jgi:hypothetical protein
MAADHQGVRDKGGIIPVSPVECRPVANRQCTTALNLEGLADQLGKSRDNHRMIGCGTPTAKLHTGRTEHFLTGRVR